MPACFTQVGSADATTEAAGAEQLVAACHQARQFTDIANFTLRCGVCQIGLKGEKEAVEHAKATGHQNFSEY
jgi:ubiquitin thioesterase OTU1